VVAQPASTSAVRLSPPSGSVPSATPPAPGSLPASYWPWYNGILQRAGRCVEQQRAYHLWVNGRPYIYILPPPGTDLEAYVDREVQVSGPVNYSGEARSHYLNAVHVVPGR
jgi:hypothetical protein